MYKTHNYISMKLLMEQLNFDELEKRISYSRLNGEKSFEFLEKNDDVSKNEYSQALKSIKKKMKVIMEEK